MNPTLEMQVHKIAAGLWTVTYGRKEASLDVQEAAFAANGLGIISPAQLGFLRAKDSDIFSSYSRTNADVFYDDRDRSRVVIVPDSAISKLVDTANLVNAHRRKEYVIPPDQRDLVYAMVDEMIKSDIAFTAPNEQTTVQPTSEFGKSDLTSRLFSDKILRIEAQEYGDWLQSQGRNVTAFFMDGENYSKDQRGPYLNRLRVYGRDHDFNVGGYGRSLGDDGGAFGVRFEKTAEGDRPKK